MTIDVDDREAGLPAAALDAARYGDVKMLVPMLDAGLPAGLSDGKGNSLLMLASYYGQVEVVELLLRHGAEPDGRNHRGQTPLAGVAFKGHLAVAQQLLLAGADPDADQGDGRTPVTFAAMFGHPQMVDLLESFAHGEMPTERILGIRPHTLVRFTGWLRTSLVRAGARI